MIKDSFEQLVGGTPLYRMRRLEEKYSCAAAVCAKLEYFNPAGSSKDRAALFMINGAEKAGKLRPGSVIIEPTSGNTGIGLCAVAASRGYTVILTMPETMSLERRKLAAAYGARVVLTPGAQGMAGAVQKARELAESTPGSFIPSQFDNPDNAEAHYRTTGPEIWEQSEGSVDIFLAAIGTGGTLTGAGRYLKEQKPGLRVYGIEPEESPLLSRGAAGPHKIQGIGANFVPEVLDQALPDGILTVSGADAYEYTRACARAEGILVGISSGAALCAAIRLAQLPENAEKTIVTVLPDTGERYLSSDVFNY